MWYISFIGYICWLCLLTITERRTSPLSWPSCLCSAPASSPGARPPPRPCGRQKVKRSDVSGWGWGKGQTGKTAGATVNAAAPPVEWPGARGHVLTFYLPAVPWKGSHPCRCAAGQARRAGSPSFLYVHSFLGTSVTPQERLLCSSVFLYLCSVFLSNLLFFLGVQVPDQRVSLVDQYDQLIQQQLLPSLLGLGLLPVCNTTRDLQSAVETLRIFLF